MSQISTNKIIFNNMIFYIGFGVDWEIQSTLNDIIQIVNYNDDDYYNTYIYFSCSEDFIKRYIELNILKLFEEKKVQIKYGVTIRDNIFNDTIQNLTGNCVINIFGHGSSFTTSIQMTKDSQDMNPHQNDLITTDVINEFGTYNSEKFFLFVFCACYVRSIYNGVVVDNVFAILPNTCKQDSVNECMQIGSIGGFNNYDPSQNKISSHHEFKYPKTNIKYNLLIVYQYLSLIEEHDANNEPENDEYEYEYDENDENKDKSCK